MTTPSRGSGEPAALELRLYPHLVLEAALHGRRATASDLEGIRDMGWDAAHAGVAASDGVRALLATARQEWEALPAAARARSRQSVRRAASAVMEVMEQSVAAFVDGHAGAGRELIRREEAERRELMSDLLRGDPRSGALAERAEPFGVDVADVHQVVVAVPEGSIPLPEDAASTLERVVLEAVGGDGVLVSTRRDGVVVIAPGGRDALGQRVRDGLDAHRLGSPWVVAVGRSHRGAHGVARSHAEAREALDAARHLNLPTSVIEPEAMMVYRVLGRDREALVDLVHTVLGPLQLARGGAAPLVETLTAYLDNGAVATVAAERLHLSVRAVTYRLARVAELTGYDATDPSHRFTLHAAVLGAALLGWPSEEGPSVVP